MAEQNPNEVTEATTAETAQQTSAPKKKAPAAKKAAAPKAAEAAPAQKSRRLTPAERADLLAAVASETADGKNTLKDTLKKFNIKEQTYYNWKNDAQAKSAKPASGSKKPAAAAKPAKAKAAASKPSAAASAPAKSASSKSSPATDELKALVALEAENQRLRKSLAEKLRKENAELRKRLGL